MTAELMQRKHEELLRAELCGRFGRAYVLEYSHSRTETGELYNFQAKFQYSAIMPKDGNNHFRWW